MVMLKSELLQAHPHLLRELQNPRIVWADEIRTRGLVHWDDDAAAVQCGIVRQLNPGEDLRPKRHLSLILSETYEARGATRSKEMTQCPWMTGSGRFVDQERRAEAMRNIIESGRRDICGKQAAAAQQAKNPHGRCFSGAGRTK